MRRRTRRRLRRARFGMFVLLLVWLLGVAAAHEVAMLIAYAAIALVIIAVDLAGAGRRHRRRPAKRRPAR